VGDIISNLVSHWPCNDNAASTVVDDIVGSNNGTLTGAGNTSASTTAGPGGSLTAGLAMDGSSDYIAITSVDYANNVSFTWAFWFRAASYASAVFMLSRAATASRHIAVSPGGTNLQAATSSAAADFTIPQLVADTWYHVAVTRASNSCRGYLNGTESVTGAVTAANNMTIDAFGKRTTTFFNGAYCDVRHYSRALAAGDVTDLYNLGVSAGGVAGPLIGGRLVGGHLTRGRLLRA
jgi:hypothetical protein